MPNYKVIHEFPILWRAWECDPAGYVLEDEKGKRLLAFDDKGQKTMKPDRLREKIAEYEKTIKATKAALYLINGGTP